MELDDKEVNAAWLNSYEKIIRISTNLDDNLKYHKQKNLEQVKFQYYTSLHFRSMIAANITYKECKEEHTNRIHLFRLENSLNMLEEIYHFIDGNKTQVACDQSLQNSLYKEIADLGTALNKYKGECEKIKLEIYR